MFRAACGIVVLTSIPVEAQRFDTLVKNAGAPRHAGVARLVPEVTIGGADATADEYLFTSVNELLAASDGTVWVIDRPRMSASTPSVRRYDPSGKFIRNVGRRGDGPGEWQQPSMLAQLRDGRVVMRDNVVGRPLTFYKLNGDHDTSWTFKTSTVHSVQADTAGAIWLRLQSGVTFRDISPVATIRMRPNGTVIDTVRTPRPPPVPPVPTFKASNDRNTTTVFAPYAAIAFSPWSPHGYYASSVNTRYAVNLLLPRTLPNGSTRLWRPGDRIMSIRRNVERVAVSEEERRDQTAHMNAQADWHGSVRHGAVPDVPRVKPVIRTIKFDLDGRLWVGVRQPSERYKPEIQKPLPGRKPSPVLKWREPTAYDLFETDGTYVGRIPVPQNVELDRQELVQSRGYFVWGVERDDDGVESVRRYRISW